MAQVQYQIFCRYYNEKVNKAATNKTEVKFVSAEINPKHEESIPGVENCYVRPEDGFYNDSYGQLRKAALAFDTKLYQIVIDETNANNPKYDMVFAYDGIATITGEPKKNPPMGDRSVQPTVYYERMKRIESDPWFLYATYSSLLVAMEKVSELVNLIGKENVIVGKIVPLDQYVDIV